MAKGSSTLFSRRGRSSRRNVTAAQVRRIVEGMAENKEVSFINTGTTISTAGTIINLSNNIVQGDDISNRTGDQVRTSLQTLHVRATAVTTSQTFRFIWFRDNFNQGTTPAVTDILNSASFMSEFNPTTKQQRRFGIFADVTLNASLVGDVILDKMLMDSKRRQIFYNGATNVAASNGKGATFVLVIGSAATGTFDLSFRFKFTDL